MIAVAHRYPKSLLHPLPSEAPLSPEPSGSRPPPPTPASGVPRTSTSPSRTPASGLSQFNPGKIRSAVSSTTAGSGFGSFSSSASPFAALRNQPYKRVNQANGAVAAEEEAEVVEKKSWAPSGSADAKDVISTEESATERVVYKEQDSKFANLYT